MLGAGVAVALMSIRLQSLLTKAVSLISNGNVPVYAGKAGVMLVWLLEHAWRETLSEVEKIGGHGQASIRTSRNEHSDGWSV